MDVFKVESSSNLSALYSLNSLYNKFNESILFKVIKTIPLVVSSDALKSKGKVMVSFNKYKLVKLLC